MPKLIDTGIDALFETIRPKEQEMLTDLLVSLLRRNAYSLDDFISGVKLKTDTLEDLACVAAHDAIKQHYKMSFLMML